MPIYLSRSRAYTLASEDRSSTCIAELLRRRIRAHALSRPLFNLDSGGRIDRHTPYLVCARLAAQAKPEHTARRAPLPGPWARNTPTRSPRRPAPGGSPVPPEAVLVSLKSTADLRQKSRLAKRRPKRREGNILVVGNINQPHKKRVLAILLFPSKGQWAAKLRLLLRSYYCCLRR